MKFSIVSALTLALAILVAAPASGFAQTVKGRYIVVLDHGETNPAGLAKGHGISPSNVYKSVFKGFAGTIPEAALKGLAKNPKVLRIVPDRVVKKIAQTLPTGIDRIDAEQAFTGQMVDADVAVLDTGIDLDHPDLNVVMGVDCRRLDKKTKDCKIGGNDDEGHGTHCAGTIGALDNGIGVVGVAPGVRLYAVKVLDRSGSGYLSWIIQGIDWTERHADVIDVASMSLGGGGSDDTDGGDCLNSADPEHMATCALVNAGVTLVVAAGNESDDAQYHTPAAYDEAITVSALADFDGVPGGLTSASYAFSSCTEAEDDSFACFSNYGHDVDIMAPGVGIYSTVPGGYGSSSGTSMAAPHVAGAAALVKAENPAFSPAEVLAELLANADNAPCATASGICLDDPDGVQEPSLMIAAGDPQCAVDFDCDDGNACTDDVCNAGFCAHTAVGDGASCGAGLCCGGSCITPACGDDAACADGDSCTTETCLNAGTCDATCQYGEPACDGTTADGCCPGACDWISDVDCPAAACGDGVCSGIVLGEDCTTCPADCSCRGKNCSKSCCGDGICVSKFEGNGSCPVDCQ